MNKLIVSLMLLSVAMSSTVQAAPVTYECTYTKYSDEKGNHNYIEPLIVRYVWDKDKNLAYVLGNVGTGEVNVYKNGGKVTFIETTIAGNIMVATINDYNKSVYSRHTEGIPSQSYGDCKFKK